MPDTTPTTDRNGLAALLAHHADVLATRWRESSGRGAWVAASTLDSHAAELTADEETPFIRDLLDSILAFETDRARLVPGTTDQQPVTAPAGTELRDRIRRAICKAEGFAWDTDMLEPDEYGEVADAVLAVLPAPTDQAELRAEVERLRGLLWTKYGATPRRMADEAQQPETETPVSDADRIVAYRDPRNPRVLLCREHGERWQGVYPVTSEDLPDGGICTFGRLSSLTCDRDVLATPAPTEAAK